MQSNVDWIRPGDLRLALLRSRQLSKPVLVDFHEPTCSGCQQLERGTYENEEIVAAIHEHTVPLRVETTASDSATINIVNTYISIATPSVQLISPTATLYHAFRGTPRLTVLCAKQIAQGERRVYVEASGCPSPLRFLGQLWIGCGKAALQQQRWRCAIDYFERVSMGPHSEHTLAAEVEYWLSRATSRRDAENICEAVS
jgi:hypothetical protein